VGAQASELAVILVTDRYTTIRKVVRDLAAQTVRDRIELVIVGPAQAGVEPEPGDADGFARVAIVDAPPLPLPAAKAAGVLAASAPFVYFAETHTYPDPHFAEAVLAAHSKGYSVVAPQVANANPEDGALSWSLLVMDYAARLAGNPAGGPAILDAYNASYRRDLLLEYGDRLARALAPGGGLDADLRRRGHRLFVEPAARIDHLNVARPGAWAAERFLGGRLLAQARVARWSTARRLVYLAGSPLVPAVLVARVLRASHWRERRRELPPATLPLLALASILWALGELSGYAFGGREAELAMAKYELHKVDYVSRPPA
jgi:hypothetical protein